MSIVTKGGDSGLTSLLCGSRVRKNDLRIEACGALDELNSFLGLSKSILKDRTAKKLIARIQKDIFVICSEIAASTASVYNRLHKRIEQRDITNLELSIEKLEKRCKSKRTSFVLPGKNTLSAALDVARSISRRAERRMVSLKNKGRLKNRYIIIYLNRLSDLLFLLARCFER